MVTIKCVLVGDSSAGKTNLLHSYASNQTTPDAYTPTVFENYAVIVKIGGKPYTLDLFDTASQEDYDRLRPLTYLDTDVFLVCYSVSDPSSYENVVERWLPEIRLHCPTTPFLLVGTHIEQRDDSKTARLSDLISFDQGQRLAVKIKAVKYVECSALTQEGLKNVFDEAILAALFYAPTELKKEKENCQLI